MTSSSLRQAASVDEIVALFDQYGTDCYDESVTQLDHALQTAAVGRAAGASDDLVAAALLHDIGHLLELAEGKWYDRRAEADHRHEATGAAYLAGLFTPAVTGPIALHVSAKRYRCAIDPAYGDGLSEGSRLSLIRQGGPMSETDAATFAAHPACADAVALRQWDDAGKVVGLTVEPFDHYLPSLHRLARGSSASR